PGILRRLPGASRGNEGPDPCRGINLCIEYPSRPIAARLPFPPDATRAGSRLPPVAPPLVLARRLVGHSTPGLRRRFVVPRNLVVDFPRNALTARFDRKTFAGDEWR